MQENSNQHIEAETFAPAPKKGQASTSEKADANTSLKSYKPTLVYAIPALLLVLALAILVIPALRNDEPSDPSISDIDNPINRSEQIEQAISTTTPDETPWADAQLLKARRDTQEILSELLGVQKRLESLFVEQWALDEFNNIKAAAEIGDASYKERLFEQSLEKYTKALDAALRLDASVPKIALEYQEQGSQLLAQNQSVEALAALDISNLLMPDSEITLNLIEQANAREQILNLIDQSNTLARNENNLEQAKLLLVEALTLDTNYSPLAPLVAEINQKILERDFRAQMSLGYSALSSGYYQQAMDAFNQAAQLKRDNNAPLEALQQVEAAKLNTQRQASLDRAFESEADEQWEEALTTYSSLLNEDDSLTAAQLGKLRSQARFNLDSDIEAIINKPLSLQSESKWQSATRTLADARGIINSGQRLNRQIKSLQELLVIARTPVVLKLNSDGLTDVEIYRIGKLGAFAQQAINLNPGKYVIVGRRNGYQDIRVELSIDGSKPEITLPVVCMVTI